ncbi:MAG: PID-CTERM protein-sorting domain-containing protein [Cytophagaceae bacterium]
MIATIHKKGTIKGKAYTKTLTTSFLLNMLFILSVINLSHADIGEPNLTGFGRQTTSAGPNPTGGFGKNANPFDMEYNTSSGISDDILGNFTLPFQKGFSMFGTKSYEPTSLDGGEMIVLSGDEFPPTVPTPIPLDGGATALILAGVALGGRQIYKKKIKQSGIN